MFGIKPRNVKGISLEDIPTFNPNQTDTEDNSIFALGLDKTGKLVRRRLPGFGGAVVVNTFDEVVDAGNTVTSNESSFFAIDKLGMTSALELSGILRNRNNENRFSSFTINSSNMNFTLTEGNSVAGTYYSNGQIYENVTDGSSNSNITINTNPGISLEARNALNYYTRGTFGPTGRLTFSAYTGAGGVTVKNLRIDGTSGIGISSTISTRYANLKADNLSSDRTIQFANASGTNVVVDNAVPPTSGSAGVLGEFRAASDYLYVCISTNIWRRIPASSW